jgi:pentapeptide repeat protein
MSEQDDTQGLSRHQPAIDDKEAWKAYWKEHGQPWRTEPEVDRERQHQLIVYQATLPDIEKGIYPFKGIRLSRADIEWLLAMQDETRGQHHGNTDGRQKHPGLDLRGADLSQINLNGLPLTHLRAGLSLQEGRHATVEQSQAAAANMMKADLSTAHLQEADLSRVLLDKAILLETHLEGADLGKASLKQAILAGTHLEGPI